MVFKCISYYAADGLIACPADSPWAPGNNLSTLNHSFTELELCYPAVYWFELVYGQHGLASRHAERLDFFSSKAFSRLTVKVLIPRDIECHDQRNSRLFEPIVR